MTRPDDPVPDIAETQRQAQHLGRTVETIFESASATVFAQLDEMRGVSALLRDIADVIGPEGQARLRASAHVAGTHLDKVQGVSGFLETVLQKLTSTGREIGDRLDRQARSMRLAGMVATNAHVVSLSLPNRDESLVTFAGDVKSILASAGSTATTVGRELSVADSHLQQVAVGIQNMTATAQTLGAVREELPGILAGLIESAGLAATLDRMSSAHGRLTAALNATVTALQTGDAARQRLDHVGAMLARSEQSGSATDQAITALATAQLAATVRDLDDAVATALPQLDAIGRELQTARQELHALAGSEIARALAETATLAGRMADGLARLEVIREETVPHMEQLASDFAHGAKTAESISNLESEMHLLGINATLMASKAGEEGRAMSEVSHQLRECTKAIGEDSAQIVSLAKLQELNAMVFTILTEQTADSATDAELRGVQDHARQLDRAVAETRARLGQKATAPLEALRTRLSAFRSEVRDSAPPCTLAPPDRLPPETLHVLGDIRATYTMQAERELHDTLFAQTGPAPNTRPALPEPAAASGELEDVFF
ncbi:hypothetical protein [Roseivivax sediminis]|uniref:Methyl-accepting chemotaxis protein n=1 Tax=Roseivivax sediminis TaxID=936889 RepID=A0A1I1UU70_9RHOB|nr:hypothetical protein [Roseivivax sediminis]SFD72413.1 hypothetical protein SAMN04515678_102440 [Roseivivax sediminis]